MIEETISGQRARKGQKGKWENTEALREGMLKQGKDMTNFRTFCWIKGGKKESNTNTTVVEGTSENLILVSLKG